MMVSSILLTCNAEMHNKKEGFMASASVTLYNGDTENTVYALAQTGPDKTLYRVAGRGLATPCTLSIERKIGPSNSKANDKVSVLLLKTEKNATTGTLVTGYVKIDISVPRDTVTFESF